METIIDIKHLTKIYRTRKKLPGISGALKGLFSRQFTETKAVDNISLTVKQGELVGFLGPNGAGKTTTLKMLSGILYPTAGEIDILGFNPSKRPIELRKQFALVMGNKQQLWWDLPARESFVLLQALYEVPEEKFNVRLREMAKLLDVEKLLDKQVRNLSLGERMKLELIAALLHDPKVIFLDEPTLGLDVVAQQKLREFIKHYNQQYKTTILLTSHYMEDIKALCKRVVIIDKGKIVYDGDINKLSSEQSETKTIKATFGQAIKPIVLKKYGNIRALSDQVFEIDIPKSKLQSRLSRLLKDFDVTDLTITETDIADVLRQLFTH